MATIDYKALAERIEAIARGFDARSRTAFTDRSSERHEERAADLRTVVSLLRGMAGQEPVLWMQSDHVDIARRSPFMARCAPSRLHPDFVPLFTHPAPQPQPEKCGCRSCLTPAERLCTFVVCPQCGNKRRPRADDHRNACTDSNDPGQPQPEHQPVSEAPGCWLFSNPEGTHKIEASSLGGLLSGIRSRFPDKCEPTEAQIERLHNALIIAEAALADIGDADREPGDDLAWCEQRAAEALPTIRAALARIEQERPE